MAEGVQLGGAYYGIELDRSSFDRDLTASERSARSSASNVQRALRGLRIDGAGVRSGGREITRELQRVEQQGRNTQRVLNTALKGVTAGIAFGAGLAGFRGLQSAVEQAGDSFVGYNARLEQTRIGFTTLLKSADAANAMLADLRKFAVETPFELPQVTEGAKQLLAYGFAAERVIPILTTVGDAASGLATGTQGIESIIRALGQIQGKGRVSAEEMNQLAEAGINGFRILAEASGQTEAKIRDLAEKGLIPANAAVDALVEGMNKQFGGAMQAQSRTLTGLLSTLRDTVNETLGRVGEPVFDVVKETVEAVLKGLNDPVAQAGMTAFAKSFGESVRSGFASLKEAGDLGALDDLRAAWDNVAEGFGLLLDAVNPVEEALRNVSGHSPSEEVRNGWKDIALALRNITEFGRDAAIVLNQVTDALNEALRISQEMGKRVGENKTLPLLIGRREIKAVEELISLFNQNKGAGEQDLEAQRAVEEALRASAEQSRAEIIGAIDPGSVLDAEAGAAYTAAVGAAAPPPAAAPTAAEQRQNALAEALAKSTKVLDDNAEAVNALRVADLALADASEELRGRQEALRSVQADLQEIEERAQAATAGHTQRLRELKLEALDVDVLALPLRQRLQSLDQSINDTVDRRLELLNREADIRNRIASLPITRELEDLDLQRRELELAIRARDPSVSRGDARRQLRDLGKREIDLQRQAIPFERNALAISRAEEDRTNREALAAIPYQRERIEVEALLRPLDERKTRIADTTTQIERQRDMVLASFDAERERVGFALQAAEKETAAIEARHRALQEELRTRQRGISDLLAMSDLSEQQRKETATQLGLDDTEYRRVEALRKLVGSVPQTAPPPVPGVTVQPGAMTPAGAPSLTINMPNANLTSREAIQAATDQMKQYADEQLDQWAVMMIRQFNEAEPGVVPGVGGATR